MKRVLKGSGYCILLLVVVVVVFFFWGSSSTRSEASYNELRLWPAETQAVKDTFSVISYNIGYLSGMTNNLAVDRSFDLFEGNLKDAISLYQKYNPDLSGFQEIDFGASRSFDMQQLDSLALHGDYGHALQAINWDKQYVPYPYWPPDKHFGEVLSGQAILSKYPLSNTRRIVLEQPGERPFYSNAFYIDRLVQVAEVDMGRPVIVINVHLEAFDKATRFRQAEVLLELTREYATTHPVILMGDFNAPPPYVANETYQEETIGLFIDEPLLASAISQHQYETDPEAHYTYSSGNPLFMIDFIFYTPSSIGLVEASVLHEAGEVSDHLPVYGKFYFKPTATEE